MWYGFGNCKSPFVNISCHLQWENMPDFNAFPVNLHWREDTKFFPACWILIGQFKFPMRQPYARLTPKFFFSLKRIYFLLKYFCEKNFLIWTNPQFSVPWRNLENSSKTVPFLLHNRVWGKWVQQRLALWPPRVSGVVYNTECGKVQRIHWPDGKLGLKMTNRTHTDERKMV